ncbi:MAG: polyketide synthase dehydratase domain-containing protein [Gemmataceae bacterium]|nr:polyketide synthase dehydratase domain-containing protein [Gemmataceae bacterium]MDW8265367.1 polyketide synthase dehydratase domain-containing protein [Gemmataceae bacterium]
MIREFPKSSTRIAGGPSAVPLPASAEGATWDVEAFVLCGLDRPALLGRIAELTAFLDRTPDVCLASLACALNTRLYQGGVRVALVAGSVAELRARLRRAAERLADPTCTQINDSQGIYFAAQPLFPEFRLAVLFAGEGSQYVNMFRDMVPFFPEMRHHFAHCDELSVQVSCRKVPISRTFLLPPDCTEAERTEAERDLMRIQNAIGAVLMSDWAVYLTLQALGVKPDAVAGHSAGEITALAAAGCIDADDFLFCELERLGNVLQQQEDEGQVLDTILLAAATGRSTLTEVLTEVGPGAYLAIDNCPHQSVAVGPPDIMERVEVVLRRRGIVCERLPFRRPYHSPLFKPYLGPVRRMYDALTIRPPRIPIYSCLTTRPMPPDPEAIKQLALDHWTGCVAFAGLIEAMYADGVRLFVESGPRGHLTSFVQDILRGRPFVAVASNLARRSGVAQIQHLAAQLAAHHVPIDLGYLYRIREVSPWAGALTGQEAVGPPPAALPPAADPRPAEPPAKPASRAHVLQQYWTVMEQFLKVQQDVMGQFLKQRRSQATATATPSPARWPMLGEIIQLDPGRTLIARRRIDLANDLFARDHTLGGRHASAVDRDQHGLPFMPMAFSMEAMAEAASVLVPGKRVIGLKRVRLLRWIPFDDDPVTIEIRATVSSGQPAEVTVAIFDLGTESRPNRASTPAVEGRVILGDDYPPSPQRDAFPLTNERPPAFTAYQLYDGEQRLFHGPIYQAVHSTDRQGDEGIEGTLRALPHTGLFRSMPNPMLILDPLLIDASTHILGCWHLGQPDREGRVVLPYEIGNVDLYGPPPPLGTLMPCRVRIGQSSTRQVSHVIEIFWPDGRLWCRLAPAEYWRFFWPPEFVDYYRFKDRFLVAKPWPAAPVKGGACCFRLEPPVDLRQGVHRAGLAHVSLAPSEWAYYRHYRGPDSRLTDWLFARLAAKDAIRWLWQQRYGERLYPADIEIQADDHGRPVARHRDARRSEPLPAVSLTHAGGMAAALAAFDGPVGIDMELVEPRSAAFEGTAFDDEERRLLQTVNLTRDEAIARFWCAKEAVAKALGRGLAEGPQSVVIRAFDGHTGTARVALGPLLAQAFPEYRLDLLIAYTARDGPLAVATTFCERTPT